MQFIFGDFVLDPARRELSHRAEVVPAGPQVFDLLLHLVKNRDRVVGKDELLEAVWKGRVVSESTITSHINAVRKAVGDSGEQQLLVRTVPRKGFRFVGEVSVGGNVLLPPAAQQQEPEPPASRPAPVLPDKPSIAVLPFHNLSGDAEQEYFADGVAEDIISALSRLRWLFVIARASSFSYRGRSVDVKEIGRELGVRYVLEGSLRKTGSKVRLTGQLIDTATGMHLWAERFEGRLDDIFALQDEMAENVVGAIAPQLERAEIERAKRKPTESLDAYDYYLRGVARIHTGTSAAIDVALPLFQQAIALDADFASAYGMAAWCHLWRKVNGWTSDRPREIAEGTRLARLAVELGRDDAVALTRGGHALAHLTRDVDGGIALLDRAVMLNPNLASAWFLGGFLRALHGEPDAALEHFSRAMRLSPLDPELFRMQAGMALAHFFAGRFDEAAGWAERAVGNLPSFLAANCVLAASHALAGRTDKATLVMRNIGAIDPSLRISNLQDWMPFHRDQDLAQLRRGLSLAGLLD